MKKAMFACALVLFSLAALATAIPPQVPPQTDGSLEPNGGPSPADLELKAKLLKLGPNAANREAAPVPEAKGGPDGFGYRYIDSNEPGGPVYSWAEISGTGTLMTGWTNPDDGWAGPFNIGFSFPFYGTGWTQFYADTNGYLTFGYGTSQIGVYCPYPNSLPNFIMMKAGDLWAGSGYYQYFSSCPVGCSGPCSIIEYQNWAYCCVNYLPDNTMETILYPNGDILLQYAYYDGFYAWGLGINGNNTGANYGLAYTCGGPSNGLAVLFYLPCPTITVTSTPSPPPGGMAGIAYAGATFSATGGTSPYTYSISSGSVPGLTLDPNSGTLAGTPTTTGTFDFTVTAKDCYGCTGSNDYSIKIAPPYDLSLLDDLGRSSLCLNSTSGSYIWKILKGTGAGTSYTGTGQVTNTATLLTLTNAPGASQRISLTYYKVSKSASGYCQSSAQYSCLVDANTANDRPCQ